MLWIRNTFNLWGIYALVYNLVLRLAPYRAMMREIVEILLRNGVVSVFDAGCGTGNLGCFLRKTCPKVDVVGVDSSPAMLTIARRKDPSSIYIQGDLNDLAQYAEGAFTAVVSVNSLYTVPNPRAVVDELKRLVHEGGTLIIATPKAGSDTWDLVREHRRVRGLLSTIVLVTLSIPTQLINAVIDRRAEGGEYHFFTEQEIRDLVGEEAKIQSTYAGIDWLVIWRKGGIQ